MQGQLQLVYLARDHLYTCVPLSHHYVLIASLMFPEIKSLA